MKKILAIILTASLLAGMTAIPALGATKQKITSVSLTITCDIQVGDEIENDGLDVESSSAKYSVGDYEFTNSGFEWYEDDIPQAKIYLYAAEGYYFSLKKASEVKLKGASYVTATKENSSQTLIITVKLPSLAESVGEVQSAGWAGTTQASWDEATGAGSYEVRIYRDGKPVGGSKKAEDNQFDFTASMGRPGKYSYKVRPVNKIKTDKKGEWVNSSSVDIDSAMAEQIRNAIAAGTPFTNPGAWVQDSVGWWYRNPDGGFTANNWQKIGDEWFFFGENGYMRTGWIEWNGAWYYCDTARGNMLVNTQTPDGYTVDANGVLVQ
ncbi:cell wall-binding protein [Clostridium sp. MCC353]|uniref:cell wall-binding protein n=1 Tax=Clostridium sp. MCC353 TaxID=2592646 RepID=UPI001C01AC31|nr:cell wall-binding protein [Clostridium sp. MCC353]MBT9775443.1 cell wall-binding protein [Clostridium sp. MCC353]